MVGEFADFVNMTEKAEIKRIYETDGWTIGKTAMEAIEIYGQSNLTN